MEGWDRGWSARSRVEGRIDEVRCRLAVEEATGGKAGGVLGAWEVEEELLDEIAELERSLTEEDGPGTSRVLPIPVPAPRGKKKWL